MSKLIKVQKQVNNNNSSSMASLEVEVVILDIIEQFREAGFSEENIKDGIENAFAEGFYGTQNYLFPM